MRLTKGETFFPYLVAPGGRFADHRRPKSEIVYGLGICHRVPAVDGRGIREFRCECRTASRRLALLGDVQTMSTSDQTR